MIKIGTLTCLHSNNVCARVGCLKAFQNRSDFFDGYSPDTLLGAMMTCNGCKSINPKVMHVGACRLDREKKECPRIAKICEMIESRGIQVVRGTHRES